MAKSGYLCLIRVVGANGTSTMTVEADRFTIGRNGADFVVNDKGVSRIHVTVHIRGREIWLEDMNSANGTFVAGTKLSPSQMTIYKPNTKVQLGLAGDIYTFELAEKIMTQKEAQMEESALIKHPSRALSVPPPTLELAEQADKFLKEARATATGIKEAASRESEALVNNSRTKANEVLTRAREEAIALLEKARNSASQATIDREKAAETALAMARKEALEIKTTADEEAENVVKEARLLVAQIKLEAQKDAEVIMQTARKTADSLSEEAEVEARELLKQTREKCRQIMEKNEAEVQEQIMAARKLASGVREEADAQLAKARAYVTEKGAALIKEAEAQAQKVVVDAEEQAANIRANAKSDAQKAVDQALKGAEHNVERIQSEAREKIESLEAEVTRLEFEVSSIEKRKRDVLADAEAVAADCESVKSRMIAEAESERMQLLKVQKALEELQIETDKARANLALANTMKENAERAAKELREEREKGLIDFENRKKAQETELANTKLHLIEEIKAKQLEEEARMHAIRGHQVTEMTRHLEMTLVPLVQKQLGPQDSAGAVAEFREAIGPIVKRVVYEEQSNLATSELEQVISSDPIIEKYKRRQKFRARAMVAVPSVMFVLAVFVPHVFEFARQPLEFISGGKSATELAAERRFRDLASKPKFDPAQVDELGDSYTDSVLYTRNYVSKKLDDASRKRWSKELENFMFRQLDLPEQIAINYIAVETRMIKELQLQRDAINPEFEKEGIARLRKIEADTLSELKGKVGGDINYDRIRKFEKDFFKSL